MANKFYAFKLYKFSAIVKTNQERQTESKNNNDNEDDWANDDENGEIQIDSEQMRNLFEILNNLDSFKHNQSIQNIF